MSLSPVPSFNYSRCSINLYFVQSDVTLTPESPLQQFIHECRDKSPLDRGRLLETDLLLGDIHASVANKGQSSVPPAGVKVDQAYACFVVAPGEKNMGTSSTEQRIFELDGTRAGPVDRGVCIDLLEVCSFCLRLYRSSHKS